MYVIILKAFTTHLPREVLHWQVDTLYLPRLQQGAIEVRALLLQAWKGMTALPLAVRLEETGLILCSYRQEWIYSVTIGSRCCFTGL